LFRPQVSAAVGVDELRVDLIRSPLGSTEPSEHVAHAQILADRLGVDRLALKVMAVLRA